MTEDEMKIKAELQNIEELLNSLLCNNKLKIVFDTYDMGTTERGSYSRVKLKVYKEL